MPKTTIQDLMNVNNSKPKTFWTPKENVNYSVRIIDTTVSKYEQDWIQKVIQHFIFKKNYICPVTKGEKCPVCEEGLKLYLKYDSHRITKEESDLFAVIKRSKRYLIQILVREEWELFKKKYPVLPKERPPFDENPVKLFFISQSFLDKIIFWASPKESKGRGLGEFWNIEKGRDIELIKQKTESKQGSMNLSTFNNSIYSDEITPLASTKEEINYILNTLCYPWEEIIKITPPEKMAEVLKSAKEIIQNGESDDSVVEEKEYNKKNEEIENDEDNEIEKMLKDLKK